MGETVWESSMMLCAAALLDDLGQFNHVAERIDESDLATNLIDLKRFGDDLYVAAADALARVVFDGVSNNRCQRRRLFGRA
jgi:hypothetical protein